MELCYRNYLTYTQVSSQETQHFASVLFLFFKIIFFKFLYQYNFETTQNFSLHVLIRYKHVHDSLQYMYGICIDLLSHLSLSFSTLECLCKCCRYKYVCKYIDKSTTWPKIAQLCVNAGKNQHFISKAYLRRKVATCV